MHIWKKESSEAVLQAGCGLCHFAHSTYRYNHCNLEVKVPILRGVAHHSAFRYWITSQNHVFQSRIVAAKNLHSIRISGPLTAIFRDRHDVTKEAQPALRPGRRAGNDACNTKFSPGAALVQIEHKTTIMPEENWQRHQRYIQ